MLASSLWQKPCTCLGRDGNASDHLAEDTTTTRRNPASPPHPLVTPYFCAVGDENFLSRSVSEKRPPQRVFRLSWLSSLSVSVGIPLELLHCPATRSR